MEGKKYGSLGHIRRIRWEVLNELVDLFAATGQIVNKKKLFLDLLNREKRATTAYEEGVALPHVRTMQARSLIMVFARSTEGIIFGESAPCLTKLFFGLVAPPYDDRLYLRVYRTLGPLLLDQEWRNKLMEAQDSHRILRLLEVARR